MKAIVATRFGDPSVLSWQEVPEPVGEVVIDVKVADVMFVETHIRRGLAPWFPVQPPYVAGIGVAGVVRSPGEWHGRRVVASTGVGGYAPRVATEVANVVEVPASVDLTDAAALIHDGRTAVGLLDSTPVHAGEQVLVTGAAGGLGLLLIQLAKAAGAHVIAAASSPAKLDLARLAGADVLVDYTATDWPDQIGHPQVVLDGVGGPLGTTAYSLVAPGGRFSAHGAASGQLATTTGRDIKVRGIEQVQYEAVEGAVMTERALAEAAAGRLKPLIGMIYPLEQAAAAHTALENRTAVGKTLLRVTSSE